MFTFSGWFRSPSGRVQPVVLALLAAVSALGGFSAARAQGPGQSHVVPGDDYFLAFGPYYAGEYGTALEAFRLSAKGGVRSTEGLWVDSICYQTMMGECYYQMGRLGEALDHYDAALKLFLTNQRWMLRVEFPPAIEPSASVSKSTINWGTTTRRSILGRFPDKMSSFQGRLDQSDVLRYGGVVATPQLFPLRVTEIVRCTALALRRRRELMGPACPHSALTAQLVAALARRPIPPNHWSGAWLDVQLGLAYAGMGKTAEAIQYLNRSILVAGRYDHPLTPTALLELGKIFFEQGKHDAAARYLLEATFAAVPYGQADVMEEAFRLGMVNHLVSGGKGVYPPLLRAPAWSRARNFPQLQTSLFIMAGENHAALGQTAAAAAMAGSALRAMKRRSMAAGNVGARYNYLAAQIAFQQGNVAAGEAALAKTMAYQKTASRWLFQIGLVDALFAGGGVTPRIANTLFANVLRDPTARDWAVDPMETLSVVVTPHLGPMEHWFETALVRNEPELALEIADRVRRHRFYSTLPLGGRLLALRWILEAPKEALSQKAQLERQDLLARYPKYAALSQQSRAIEAELAAMPLVPDDDEAVRKQKALLAELAKRSAVGEVVLREIAVRREPSEFAFPPIRSVKEIQEGLGPRQIALVYFATSRYVHAFVFSHDKYAHWPVQSARKMQDRIAGLLRDVGNFDKNYQLNTAKLRADAWKEAARDLLPPLANNAPPDAWDKYDELIVVPDGVLWHLPFELLQVPGRSGSRPLIEKVRIRYAPTAGTILPDGRGRRRVGKTAVVLGRLYPQDKEETAARAFDDIRRVLPDSVAIESSLPAPSNVFASLWYRLIVLDDVQDAGSGPYAWAPAQIDGGTPGSTLAGWGPLPFAGPDQIVLPGFHTAAEYGLKGNESGNELFLTVCGLMATGARTVLLSRWRTGGGASYDLVREFVQELPHTSADNAWQRSVQLAMESEVDPDREPRVKASAEEGPIKANHPFFWAGYLLVDTGTVPKTDQPEKEPVLRIERKK